MWRNTDGIIITLAFGIFMVPLAVDAQQLGTVPWIGMIGHGAPPDETQ